MKKRKKRTEGRRKKKKGEISVSVDIHRLGPTTESDP
jgi:hypothetical protein